jgi:hypothetical protein
LTAESGAEVEENPLVPGAGSYDIRGPAYGTSEEPAWVYIYFQNEGSDPLSYTLLSSFFSSAYDGDTSFPFYTVTADNPDPSSQDFVLPDFEALDGSISTQFGFNQLPEIVVPPGQYYLFGIYKKAGDFAPVVKGAELNVGFGLPSCAADDGVQAQSNNKIRTKRPKRARSPKSKRKQDKHTRPPTKM